MKKNKLFLIIGFIIIVIFCFTFFYFYNYSLKVNIVEVNDYEIIIKEGVNENEIEPDNGLIHNTQVIEKDDDYVDPNSIDNINGGMGKDGKAVSYIWKYGNLPNNLLAGDYLEFVYESGTLKLIEYAEIINSQQHSEYFCHVPWKIKLLNYTGKKYYKIRKITEEDIEIIEGNRFGDYYYKDKDNIYYKGRVLEAADAKSFEKIDNNFFRDKDFIYSYDGEVMEFHRDTFEILDDYYTKDKNGVYYNRTKIKDADIENFILLGFGYARDGFNVYNHGKIIEGVDVGTIKVFSWNFFKDKEGVYRIYEYNGEIKKQEKYDPESFVFLDEYGKYIKDKNAVYCNRDEIIDADPNTFVVLSSEYAKDKNNIYRECDILEGVADPGTFQFLNEHYSKDRLSIYYDHEIVEEIVDPETFELLDDYNIHMKDKYNVYCSYSLGVVPKPQIIEGADPNTFEVIDSKYSKDKNNNYEYCVKVENDSDV